MIPEVSQRNWGVRVAAGPDVWSGSRIVTYGSDSSGLEMRGLVLRFLSMLKFSLLVLQMLFVEWAELPESIFLRAFY